MLLILSPRGAHGKGPCATPFAGADCCVYNMLALAGHMAVSMYHPFLLALLGPFPLRKSLKGRMAEVHVTPLLLTLTGPCILGWGL